MRFAIVAIAAFIGILAGIEPASADKLTTATGYSLSYDVYKGASSYALIFMHGKNGTNMAPNVKEFANRIAKAGFTVYLPLMPWSRNWDGTAADAVSAVDALVELAAKDGKKVFVGGQSMGAMFTISYRPDDLPSAVVGKVMTSAGGMLDMLAANSITMKVIQPSVNRAKALEAEGKGKIKTRFEGGNVSGEKNVEEVYDTTPEIFLSFHDVARAPASRIPLTHTKVPVFWSAGSRDPIPNNKKRTFEMIPANPASTYLETSGDHNSNMMVSIDPIIAWLKARAAQ